MIKGLSIPVVGKYQNNNGTVTYSEPTIADHAVSYGISWTTSDNNPGYADNQIQENDKGTFQSGELTLGTADLPQKISAMILGIKVKESVQFGPTGSQITADIGIYDDDQSAPFLGFGIIEMHQIDDVDKFRAVFLNKVYFNLPEESAETKGKSIEWQTKEITGAIQRSDEVNADRKHPWMEDAWFDTESNALEFLQWKCGKTYNES